MTKMKKDELVSLHKDVYEELFEGTITKKESEALLEVFFKTLERAIEQGFDVSLGNLGTFKQKERAERNGINPQTKEAIVIPASKSVGFTPSKQLKGLLNNK